MSTPPGKKNPPADALGKPYIPGEPLPATDVVEKNSDTAWAMFQAIQAGTHDEFPTTARDTLDQPGGRHAPWEKALKPLTEEEVMFEARRNNRVCPMPSHWQRLYHELEQFGADVPRPVGVSAWNATSSLEKRARLRSQAQWAAQHGALDTMFAFLRELPDENWARMED